MKVSLEPVFVGAGLFFCSFTTCDLVSIVEIFFFFNPKFVHFVFLTLFNYPSPAMRSFVAHCPELLTEDVIRKLMTPIECAMTMMSQ